MRGRIINTLERLAIQLPQYHNAKADRFLVETKPRFFVRKWIPYFVGNRVTFKIRIHDTEERVDGTSVSVVESFGREERISLLNGLLFWATQLIVREI